SMKKIFQKIKNSNVLPPFLVLFVILIMAIFGTQVFKADATTSYLGGANNMLFVGGGAILGNDSPATGLAVVNGTSYFMGSVGIGTASPGVKLNLYTTSGELAIRLQNASSGGRTWDLDSKNTSGSFSIIDRTSNVDRLLINSSGKVGIGTTAPASLLSVGGAGSSSWGIYGIGSTIGVYGEAATGSGAGVFGGNNGTGAGVQGTQSGSGYGVAGYGWDSIGVYGFTGATAMATAGVVGKGGGTGVYGSGSNYGVVGMSSSIGVYASGGSGTGVVANGSTQGILTNTCTGCSILAEMITVSETPNNGDIMCTNPNTGKTEICREDKSDYIKGIAQKYAETVMRMGCSKTLDQKNGENNMSIGVMDVDAWQKLPECKGWYPIALSGLSEKTNVVCETPSGKRLGYGDILVSSNIPGRLRPLDKDEAVQSYQIAGRVDTLCAAGKKTDSIMVWIQ
ncbi:MAG TPA: hypothetical protein VFD16_00870, partial [Candidatus Saccharimonadales bacterium]|nr:hypothetical protein [Candidatus Saccharimonadales bacterium]